MANELPGTIETLTRDEYRDLYRRDYELFVPGADTGPGTQPYVDASLAADSTMVLFADAVVIGNGTNLATSSGDYLYEVGDAEGVPPLEPTGASGYVIVSTSAGGSKIFQGDELVDQNSELRFQVQSTNIYGDGDLVAVLGIDTGVETNLPAGATLVFTSPRPGCGPNAVVFEQADGSGLTGGRGIETEDEYRERVRQKRANPPASGNDAEYQRLVQEMSQIAVQKAFTYPAVFGPGTTAVTFTVRTEAPGAAGRIPNAAQMSLAMATVQDAVPGDDGVFVPFMQSNPVSVVLRVDWADGAAGWYDTTIWPTYELAAVNVATVPAPTATSLRAFTLSATPAPDPQVGQVIGLYDRTSRKFVRKQIATVSVVSSGVVWDLTFDTTNAASDSTFVPVGGALVCPWSDNLNDVVPTVLKNFDAMGPGEMFPSFADPGYRQKRNPPSSKAYPSAITNQFTRPILEMSVIGDAVLLEPTIPYETPVGIPGTLVYLSELSDLAIYGF